jgi:Na+/melibiose symporter-like transporter
MAATVTNNLKKKNALFCNQLFSLVVKGANLKNLQMEVVIFVSLFLTIFGLFYLFFVTRNRERMALIEKGQSASLFYPEFKSIRQMRRFIVRNIAFTLIGIGLGVLLGILLYNATGEEAVYPATIAIMGGAGLLVSSMVNRKLEEDL